MPNPDRSAESVGSLALQMIHVIADTVSAQQLQDMLQTLQTYIKLAVDVRREVLAGGGEMHADCEAALLEDGSRQEDVWGADWFPESRTVRFQSLINIRPKQGNRTMELTDTQLRQQIESIVKQRLVQPHAC